VTDDAACPHRQFDRVTAKLYFGIADRDANATPGQLAKLERELCVHGVDYQFDWHPGALHGEMMLSWSELYNETAAETVRGRTQDLFARKLP
jgi:carboxymethylenebutenolidase